MKTINLLVGCVLLASLSVQAQKVYLRAGVGAAVTTSATYAYETTLTSGNDVAKELVKVKKSGLGTGLPFALAAGYTLNDHFAFELAVDYFYGLTRKTTDNYYGSTFECKKSGQMLSLIPALVFGLPIDKFYPYARLGLIIGVLNSVTWKYHYNYVEEVKILAMEVDETYKDYGGMAMGVQAVAGGAFAINDMFSLFGEIQVNGISYAPKHGKISAYDINGEDKLGDLDTNEKEWDYVKEMDRNETIPDDEPCKEPKVNHHFSDVGLVIGVKINLTKK